MHVSVGKLTSIGSDNGLSPRRRQAITWTNAKTLLIGLLGRNFSDLLIEIDKLSFNKLLLKMSTGNSGHRVSALMCYIDGRYPGWQLVIHTQFNNANVQMD